MRKKMVTAVLAMSLVATGALPAAAHPGRTDSKGGHTCRTNCAKWGLKQGEYHYHNGGSSSKSSSGGSSGSSSSSSGSTSGSSSSKPATTAPKVEKPTYTQANTSIYLEETLIRWDAAPLLIDGTTMVPLRTLAKELGAELSRSAKDKSITVSKGQQQLVFTPGSKKATVNGASVTLDTQVKEIDGTTYAPLRTVVEGLGATLKQGPGENGLTIQVQQK